MFFLTKISEVTGSPNITHMFWCDGCKHVHTFNDKTWKFNGDLNNPTISPSILVQWYDEKTNKMNRCHSFIRDGKIRYLSDCNTSFER